MAIRTTADKVKDILGDNYDGCKSLIRFIKSANVLTNWLVTCDTAMNGTPVNGEEQLQEIESYLAAHFYEHHDKSYTSKSTGGASGSFKGQYAMILLSTDYGQTAMLLDASGCLAKKSKEAETGQVRKVGMVWLGTQPGNIPTED